MKFVTRENMLGTALRNVLVACGVLLDNAAPTGPELILAAEDYCESKRPILDALKGEWSMSITQDDVDAAKVVILIFREIEERLDIAAYKVADVVEMWEELSDKRLKKNQA